MKVIVIALAVLPTILAAQDKEAYGNETGCNYVTGAGPTNDDMLVVHVGEAIRYWEEYCEFITYEALSDGSVLLHTDCWSEGMNWTRDFVLATTDRDSVLLSYEPGGEGTELMACG